MSEVKDKDAEVRYPIPRQVVGFIVGRSVSGIVVTIVHQNIETFSKLQKVQLYIGAYVVGSMVADSAENYVDKKIDRLVEVWDNFRANPDPRQAETPQ